MRWIKQGTQAVHLSSKNAKRFDEARAKNLGSSSAHKALEKKKGGKKMSLEERSKKSGFYVHGHKNLGDVYEA